MFNDAEVLESLKNVKVSLTLMLESTATQHIQSSTEVEHFIIQEESWEQSFELTLWLFFQ